MNGVIRIAQQTARWAARVISTLATAFWLLILLDIITCDALAGFICVNWEMALLFVIVAISIICVILAWRTESIGGFALMLWGIIFTTIAAVEGEPYVASSIMVSGFPFFLAGLLFLASWWL